MPFESVERSIYDRRLSLRARTVVELRYTVGKFVIKKKKPVFKVWYGKMCSIIIIIIIVSAGRFGRGNFSCKARTALHFTSFSFRHHNGMRARKSYYNTRRYYLVCLQFLCYRLVVVDPLCVSGKRGFSWILACYFFATTERKPFFRRVIDLRRHLPGV